MSANEHDDDRSDSEDMIEALRARIEGMRQANIGMEAERNSARGRAAKLANALIEATAELIYLRQYGKDGAVWWANESKDVWRGKAIATLALPAPEPTTAASEER